MGVWKNTANRERKRNRNVEIGARQSRILAVTGVALILLAAAIFAVTAGPEPAQASVLGIPCR